MALRKKKVYSRFCVGAMMKARKTAREQIAAAHKSVAALKKNVESLMAKRRRLEAKVISLFLIERYLCVQLDQSNLVKIIFSYEFVLIILICLIQVHIAKYVKVQQFEKLNIYFHQRWGKSKHLAFTLAN